MKEQISKGNKLIALFMGAEIMGSKTSPQGIVEIQSIAFKEDGSFKESIRDFERQLKYHSSWNWLMPVIEKISEYKYENSELNIDRAYPRTFGMSSNKDSSLKLFRFNRMPLHQSETLIEASWKAVIEFIEYYNESLKD